MKFSLPLAALVAVVHAAPFVVPPPAQPSASLGDRLANEHVERLVRMMVEGEDDVAASMEPMITPEIQIAMREIGEGNYTPMENEPEPGSQPESQPPLEEDDDGDAPLPSAEADIQIVMREIGEGNYTPESQPPVEEEDEAPLPSAGAELEVEMDVAMREEAESDDPTMSAEPVDVMATEPPVRFPNNQRPFPV
ncbi:hypothetical protein FGB62_59g037 [Gracilaria domingensis]|nr:hypothetical protein FGB62_59g037 [Gracilaria domingensis]